MDAPVASGGKEEIQLANVESIERQHGGNMLHAVSMNKTGKYPTRLKSMSN